MVVAVVVRKCLKANKAGQSLGGGERILGGSNFGGGGF